MCFLWLSVSNYFLLPTPQQRLFFPPPHKDATVNLAPNNLFAWLPEFTENIEKLQVCL